jgi:hypothetical protein
MGIDVTKMIEPARQALEPAAASLSEAWAAVMGDRITAWRLKNAAALQIAINKEVGKLGLKLDRSKIPERYAFAWFEEATKQDEPEIQQLFARLLSRAAAGDEDAADRRNLDILTHFTPMDATVMRWFFNETKPPPAYPEINEYEAWSRLQKEVGDGSDLALEHLVNLGVLERSFSLKKDEYYARYVAIGPHADLSTLLKDLHQRLTVEAELRVTSRGLSLYNACYPEHFAGEKPKA